MSEAVFLQGNSDAAILKEKFLPINLEANSLYNRKLIIFELPNRISKKIAVPHPVFQPINLR